MTHNQLLERINDQEFAYAYLANALLAVMEEHRPCLEDCNQDGKECGSCLCGQIYPCSTFKP